MPSRHSRPAVLATPYLVALLVVLLGGVAVGLVADERLALQLALAGVLAATVMVWMVYDAALRETRSDLAHEAAVHGRTTRSLAAITEERDRSRAKQRDAERALEQLADAAELALREATARAERAESGLLARPTAPASASPEDIWTSVDAPTVVTLANRREDRPDSDEPAAGVGSHRATSA